VAALCEAGDEVKRRVDDAPRKVATDRADEHRAHVFRAGLGDADRTREREHHDQPEDNFGETFERIQNASAVISEVHDL
jgi:hypothetical protein